MTGSSCDLEKFKTTGSEGGSQAGVLVFLNVCLLTSLCGGLILAGGAYTVYARRLLEFSQGYRSEAPVLVLAVLVLAVFVLAVFALAVFVLTVFVLAVFVLAGARE